MPAQLIDGRAIAHLVRAEVRTAVDQWTAKGHRTPYLAVVLVGDNPASASYVRGKIRASQEAGILGDTLKFGASLPESELLAVVQKLGRDDDVDGILIQLPLPDHICQDRIISAIHPDKDVDGLHVVNAGRLVSGRAGFVPCTPAGIVELLQRTRITTSGQHTVIIGRSNLVGKPLANLMLKKGIDSTVTVCHSRTRNLKGLCHTADIVVAAIGRAGFVTDDMIKPGATVIDVGINRVEDLSRKRGYRLTGDVAFKAVRNKASRITPVPGGVGPMTIAMLLKNTLLAAQRQKHPKAR